MLVECCKKSEILVAFLSLAIFRELPVYVGQAVPFFNYEKDIAYCAEMTMWFLRFMWSEKIAVYHVVRHKVVTVIGIANF